MSDKKEEQDVDIYFLLQDISDELSEAFEDVEKLEGGNTTAGKRIRDNMQKIRMTAHTIRSAAGDLVKKIRNERKRKNAR